MSDERGPDETQPVMWQWEKQVDPVPEPPATPAVWAHHPPQPPAGYPAPYPAGGWPSGPYPTPYASGAYPAMVAAPFGVHPITGIPYSDKSKATAGLLQLLLPFLGVCGVGRLYAGHTAIGLVQLLGLFLAGLFSLILVGVPFLIGIWLWSVIDGIVLLAGDSKDSSGRLLR